MFFPCTNIRSVSITTFFCTLHTHTPFLGWLVECRWWSNNLNKRKSVPDIRGDSFSSCELAHQILFIPFCNAYVFSWKFNFAAHSIRYIFFAERSTFRIECDCRECVYVPLNAILGYSHSFRFLAFHTLYDSTKHIHKHIYTNSI